MDSHDDFFLVLLFFFYIFVLSLFISCLFEIKLHYCSDL